VIGDRLISINSSVSLIVLLSGVLAFATATLAADHVIQYNSGHCSVNIANVSGNVHVEGGCMDEKIISQFLDTINRQQKDYQEKAAQVESWIKRYDDLRARLGASGAFDELRSEVRRHFENNDLDAAGRAKEQLISAEEDKWGDQLAKDYYERAEMLVLQFKQIQALPFYAKAFRYRPENPLYAEAYARNLCDTNQRDKAVKVYEVSANELRSLVKVDPDKYAPSLSCTLIDLAGLYYDDREYLKAHTAAEEALSIANLIVPRDGREAQEHIADALTGLGINEAKLGRPKAKDNLLEAERIYSQIGVTNSNRPILLEALAQLAGKESNEEQQEQALSRAVKYELELTQIKPIDHHSKLATRMQLLVDFYQQRALFDKASSLTTELENFISTLPVDDRIDRAFLAATNAQMRCGIGLLQSRLKEARPECLKAIQTFDEIRQQLRPRESAIYSLSYDNLGWLNIEEGEYRSALEAFDRAIAVNLYTDGPQMRRAMADKRLAQFFVIDFPAAANDLLTHSDDMPEFDRAIWDFFIRKRADPYAKIELGIPAGGDEPSRILAEVVSERLPMSALTKATTLATEMPDANRKCRTLFYIGEVLVLSRDVSAAIQVLSKCSGEPRGSIYPWLMKAETIHWSQGKRS
jgi:hypothetical protein